MWRISVISSLAASLVCNKLVFGSWGTKFERWGPEPTGGEQGLTLWAKIRFAGDSPLEGAGFELAVLARMERLW